MKVFETFAGYGGWSFALKQLGVEHEVVGYSEVDKYAIQCYEQNHKGKNYGDITNINPHELPDFDLFVSSPPCQAFSVAGKGEGKDDEKGRGRLFEDAIEIMRVKQPKYAVYENVKGLTFKTHKEYFDYIQRLMKNAGYYVFWKVLNTKEHGIPQNRERVFLVCIRNDIVAQKVETPDWFRFPESEELKIFLKDILEDEVDEKYYLAPERVEKLLDLVPKNPKENHALMLGNLSRYKMKSKRDVNFKEKGVSWCVDQSASNGIIQVGQAIFKTTKRTHDTPVEINVFLKANKGDKTIQEISDYLQLPKTQVEHYFRTDKSRAVPKTDVWLKLKELLSFDDSYDKMVTETYEKEIEFESTGRVYSQEGCSACLSATQADKIIQVNNPKHSNNRVYSPEGCGPTLRDMSGSGSRQPFIVDDTQGFDGVRNYEKESPSLRSSRNGLKVVHGTLTTALGRAGSSSEFKDSCSKVYESSLQIRKLTPKECFRLQGFLNDEINLEGLSNTQQYKLAGNGVSINVCAKLLRNILK